MKFGLDVGTYGPLAQREQLLPLAAFAESHGFESLWLADHVIFPMTTESRYPYSPSGAFPVDHEQPLLEPVATMGVLIGATSSIRIGTAVLVMPYRNPLVLAKMLVTYDQLSNGRVTLGAGVGWLEEEFDALHTAPFKSRGAVTYEYLGLIKQACAGGELQGGGEHYPFAPVAFHPGSIQKPHIPIVIGGTTDVALKRVARQGDGWLSVAVQMADMPSRLAQLDRFCEAQDRSVSELKLYHKLFLNIGEERESVYGGREPGTGSIEQITDDVARLAEFGFDEAIIRYVGTDAGEQTSQLTRFVEEVMVKFA